VGGKIVEICKFGDEFIESRTASIFRNKGKNGKVPLKGVAFPVCLSVNEAVCHVSPIESDASVSDTLPVMYLVSLCLSL
jgi:methionine aminopeptidase